MSRKDDDEATPDPLIEALKGHERRAGLVETRKGTEKVDTAVEPGLKRKEVKRWNGLDIVRKGAKKTRYVFLLPASFECSAAGGQLGIVTQMDTETPILYIDFPEGRMKCQGRIVKPNRRLVPLTFTRKMIVCKDIVNTMVVFSQVSWIGKAEENPMEKPLDFPVDESAISAAELFTRSHNEEDEGPAAEGTPSSRRKRKLEDEDSSEHAEEEGGEEGGEEGPSPQGTGARAHLRRQSATARRKYAEESDEVVGEDSVEDNEEEEEEEEVVEDEMKESTGLGAKRRKRGLSLREEGSVEVVDVEDEKGEVEVSLLTVSQDVGKKVVTSSVRKRRRKVESEESSADDGGELEQEIVVEAVEPRAQRPSRGAAAVARTKFRVEEEGGDSEEAWEEEDAEGSLEEDGGGKGRKLPAKGRRKLGAVAGPAKRGSAGKRLGKARKAKSSSEEDEEESEATVEDDDDDSDFDG